MAISVAHNRAGGPHVGISFHAVLAGPQILHLKNHLDLASEKIDPALELCWIAAPLELPPSASKQVVAYVRTVAKRLARINYGTNFLAAKGSFDPKGSYKAPKGSLGLTCASFVLEVLRGASVKLIDEVTWKPTPENRAWAEDVCSWLIKFASAEHVEAVRRGIDGLRLHPWEVAAAGSLPFKQRPAAFEKVSGPASAIDAEITAACPCEEALLAAAVAAIASPDTAS